MSQTKNPKDWATTSEVAASAGIHQTTVGRWLKLGLLPTPELRSMGRRGRTTRWPMHAPEQARWVQKQLAAKFSIEEVREALGRGEFVPDDSPVVGTAEQMPSPRTGLLDDPRGREVSRLAFAADQLRGSGDEVAAREHYARAAALEAQILWALPAGERSLYNVLAVSAAALWFKAKDTANLDELADRLLAGDGLTTAARAEIAEMRTEAGRGSRSTARRLRGAEKTAARRLGLTVDEYRARVDQGLKFCTNCKTWHPLEAFGSDASRSDGRAALCRISQRARQRDRYIPRLRADGQRHAPACDGDVQQARRRLTHLIEIGRIPHPSKLACVKCGHTGTDRQHVYRHPQGFAPEHHETVEVVCSCCDPARKGVDSLRRQKGE